MSGNLDVGSHLSPTDENVSLGLECLQNQCGWSWVPALLPGVWNSGAGSSVHVPAPSKTLRRNIAVADSVGKWSLAPSSPQDREHWAPAMDSQDPVVHPFCVALINLSREPVHLAVVLGPSDRWAILGVETMNNGRAFNQPEGGPSAACLGPAASELVHAQTLCPLPLRACPCLTQVWLWGCNPWSPGGVGWGWASNPRNLSTAWDEGAQCGPSLGPPCRFASSNPVMVTTRGREKSLRRNPEPGMTPRLRRKAGL